MIGELKVGIEKQKGPLHGDSTGSLKLAGEQQYSPRTKQCGLRFFILKNLVDGKRTLLKRAASADNTSDLLTKYLSRPTMNALLKLINAYQHWQERGHSMNDAYGSIVHHRPMRFFWRSYTAEYQLRIISTPSPSGKFGYISGTNNSTSEANGWNQRLGTTQQEQDL